MKRRRIQPETLRARIDEAREILGVDALIRGVEPLAEDEILFLAQPIARMMLVGEDMDKEAVEEIYEARVRYTIPTRSGK